MDILSAMDVTVYPPPPQPLVASDHTRLGQLSYPDPAFGTSKVSKERKNLSLYLPWRRDESHVCGSRLAISSLRVFIYCANNYQLSDN